MRPIGPSAESRHSSASRWCWPPSSAVQQTASSLTPVVFDQFLRRTSNQVYFGFFIGAMDRYGHGSARVGLVRDLMREATVQLMPKPPDEPDAVHPRG
jgi:hypothetical protein